MKDKFPLKAGIDESSAGIVLFRQMDKHREYLILHYQGGHFDLPKGHLEEGESPREAAIRELFEETGIKNITWIEGYNEKITYTYMKFGKLSTKEVTFFLARTTQKKVTISDEHQNHVWLPYEQAVEKMTFENAKNLVRKAESYLLKRA
jgi:bis(5'-nucleosidyl)-tetraphosphatase